MAQICKHSPCTGAIYIVIWRGLSHQPGSSVSLEIVKAVARSMEDTAHERKEGNLGDHKV